MSDILTIEDAQAARDQAFAKLEEIGAQLKSAAAEIEHHAPAAAVARGASLADAATRQAEARQRAEYLAAAQDHAWAAVLVADENVKAAQVRAIWKDKLRAAIAARIDACEKYEAAIAAKSAAIQAYENATAIIAAAFAAGMPKPARLNESPLHLGAKMVQAAEIVLPAADEQRDFWNSAK